MRPGGEGACQFQALASGDRKIEREFVELAGEAHLLCDMLGVRQRGATRGAAQVRADGDVLAHGLRAKGLHDLEGARHAEAAN